MSLFEILEEKHNNIIIKITNEDHPIFKAHFPGNPILPAFCQIDIVEKLLDDKIYYIKNSKFISHISPNDIIKFTVIEKDIKRKVEIYKENNKVSEITYERN